MGYSEAQIAELAETIHRTPCDTVVVGTPIDLRRVLKIDRPATRVRYELRERTPGALEKEVCAALGASSQLALAGVVV
jgi:predicted GTPase